MNVEILETLELCSYLDDGNFFEKNYYRRKLQEPLNNFIQNLSTSIENFYIVIIEKKVNSSLTEVKHINMKFSIMYFENENNKNAFVKYFNKNKHENKINIPWDIASSLNIRNICNFEMRPLDNCCGICISTNYYVYNYLNIRHSTFNEWALEMKKAIAKNFSYSILMLSLRIYEGKRYYSLLKDKLGMKEVLKFRNLRTANNLAVLTVELN